MGRGPVESGMGKAGRLGVMVAIASAASRIRLAVLNAMVNWSIGIDLTPRSDWYCRNASSNRPAAARAPSSDCCMVLSRSGSGIDVVLRVAASSAALQTR